MTNDQLETELFLELKSQNRRMHLEETNLFPKLMRGNVLSAKTQTFRRGPQLNKFISFVQLHWLRISKKQTF